MMQIHTYCRGCHASLPVNGLVRQDVTCPACGADFVFGEGSLYLAPPPDMPEDANFRYQATMKNGDVVNLATEKPPLPEGASAGGDPNVHHTLFGAAAAGQSTGRPPERLALSQKREVIAALAMPLVTAAEAQGQPMSDETYFKLVLTAAHDLFEAEAAGRLPAFLAEFDVAVPPAVPEVPMPEGAAAIDVSNVHDPEWSPLVLEARRNAMRNVTMRSRAGEAITPAKVKVEMALQQMLLEFAEPARRAAAPAAPAPSPGARMTPGETKQGGWLFFAVGFLFAALALPLSYFATQANELFGIVVLLGLLGIGVHYLYQGLRQALATGPVVSGILVAVALNPAMIVGMVGCSALGINPFGPEAEVAQADPVAANASRD